MRQLILNQPQRVAAWVYSQLPYADDATAFEAIGIECRGELIAGFVFNSYTGHDVDVTLVAKPGTHWAHPRWLTQVCRYVFVQLGCRRVSANTASTNRPCIAALLALGFKPEGCKREALPEDDLLMFGMTRSECRWLETLQ